MRAHKLTIVSLFDATGAWSAPYCLAGYNVIQVDLCLGTDILAWQPPAEPVHGVLAAPPCTDFAGSGAQHWAAKDSDGRTLASIQLVLRTLTLIDQMRPQWWVLENPVGRLNKLIPALQPWGPRYFQPFDYGDPYTKKTGLWGSFMMPPPAPVRPHLKSLMLKMGSGDTARSTTPRGFANAFFFANP